MGFYETESCQTKTDPRSENRVGGSSRFASTRTRFQPTQTPETTSETSVTITITVSGLPFWLSRDPVGERADYNLYGFVGNEPVGWMDILGLTEAAPPKTKTVSQEVTLSLADDGWDASDHSARALTLYTRLTIERLDSAHVGDSFKITLEVERANASPTIPIAAAKSPAPSADDFRSKVTAVWSGNAKGCATDDSGEEWAYGNFPYWCSKDGGYAITAIADWSGDSASMSGWDSPGANGKYHYTRQWSGAGADRVDVVVHLMTAPPLQLDSKKKLSYCLSGKLSIRLGPASLDYSGGRVAGPVVLEWGGTTKDNNLPTISTSATKKNSAMTADMGEVMSDYAKSLFDSKWGKLKRHGWVQ